MDGETFLETLREAKATELDRLGSDKVLLATTGGSLDETAVRAALASADATVREVYREWSTDEPDVDAGAAFVAAADQAADHAQRIAEPLDDEPAIDVDDPVAEYLRSQDATVDRLAAGLVARPLVRDRTLLQAVNFFVNEADRTGADLARDLRTDVEITREDGLDLLVDRCDDAADEERAREAAAGLVDAAYRGYVDALDELGLDPRPIC
ncbi:MAG: rubrerythrin family protein [Haloarculaceae archaeon]